MKALRQLFVASVFALALSLPVVAGEISTTVTSQPPTQPAAVQGQIDTPLAGQVETGSGEESASDSLAAPPDTTAPGLNISFPADGQEFPGTQAGTAVANMAGTANDVHSGVQKVEVKLDNGAYTQATPGNPDWSSWSQVVNVPSAGNHTLTARCTDKAGNRRQRRSRCA